MRPLRAATAAPHGSSHRSPGTGPHTANHGRQQPARAARPSAARAENVEDEEDVEDSRQPDAEAEDEAAPEAPTGAAPPIWRR